MDLISREKVLTEFEKMVLQKTSQCLELLRIFKKKI